jgi:hypothetical protein
MLNVFQQRMAVKLCYLMTVSVFFCSRNAGLHPNLFLVHTDQYQAMYRVLMTFALINASLGKLFVKRLVSGQVLTLD